MALKILIIEDEPIISEDLASILINEGHKVAGQAYDGAEALDMIANRVPDLVLIDIALGHQMTGLEVAAIIKEKYQLPFIFITSYSDRQTLQEAKELMPEGYIVKPFKKKDIIVSIEMTEHRLSNIKPISPYKTLPELNVPLHDEITRKEYDLLLDLAAGMTNEQVSEKHFISLNTVKTHFRRLYTKLNVNSRSQAVAMLLK